MFQLARVFTVAAVLALSVSLLAPIASDALGQQVGVVCPKCGKVHGPSSSSVVQASATSPSSYSPSAVITSPTSPTQFEVSRTSSGSVSNVLSILNAQRARQGVGQLSYDPQLQAVAEQRAEMMARSGNKSHPPGSFSPGRYEGVGWSSSFSPSGVSACFTSDSRMRMAGAAMARGRDGVYFAVVYR